jgi:hypothetical protein
MIIGTSTSGFNSTGIERYEPKPVSMIATKMLSVVRERDTAVSI